MSEAKLTLPLPDRRGNPFSELTPAQREIGVFLLEQARSILRDEGYICYALDKIVVRKGFGMVNEAELKVAEMIKKQIMLRLGPWSTYWSWVEGNLGVADSEAFFEEDHAAPYHGRLAWIDDMIGELREQ